MNWTLRMFLSETKTKKKKLHHVRHFYLDKRKQLKHACIHTLFSDNIIKRLLTLILFDLSDTFSLLFISFYCSNLFFALIFPASLLDDHPQRNPASKVLESRLDPSIRQVRFPQEAAKAAVAVRGPLRAHVSGGGVFYCFFLACEKFWECSTLHSPPALSFSFSLFFFFFFFWLEISLSTLIPLFRPGSVHSGSASWDDFRWVFSVELGVSFFPDRLPLYLCLDSDIVSPLRLRLVEGLCVFRCNLPPALLAEWPGSFRATAVTRGRNGTETD